MLEDVKSEDLRKWLGLFAEKFCFGGEKTCPYSVQGDEFRMCELEDEGDNLSDWCPILHFVDFVVGHKDTLIQDSKTDGKELEQD